MTAEEIKKLLKELVEIDKNFTSEEYEEKKPARAKEIEHELYIVGVFDSKGAFVYTASPIIEEFAEYYMNLL